MSRENAVRTGSYPVADLWISEVNMKSARSVAFAAALLIAAPEFAAAQGIPLPQPAPRSRNQPARSPALPTDAAGRPIPVRPPGESVPYEGSQSQRALVDRVSTYLSSLQALIGDFVQIGPDGGRSVGKFYIQKPGRVRFEYDPPSPIELISDGSSVVVRDRNLATQDLYPLSQTPLRYLLADQIDLARDTNLIAVSQDNTFITVTIEERQILIGTHRLVLMFGAKDTQLRQWTVTDPQGYETTVAVYNLDVSHRPDPSLFMINYGFRFQ
jgi:outer membrane lipoprotein-sorting protein